MVICLDGVSWDYISAADTPNLDEMARIGVAVECDAMVPTVTNVNASSILTGKFPEVHGISSNWYYDRVTGEEVYMDSWRFLRCRTLLQKAADRGAKTLLLTVKDKLRRLIAEGAGDSYSVEKPDPKLVEGLGAPPSIYSSEASPWLLKAVEREVARGTYDVIYVQTTDYIPHKYPPESEEAERCMEMMDEQIGRILEHGVHLGITADHGMGEKRVNLDLAELLKEQGLEARFIAAIRDEHVTHHSNLGGAAYLYLPRGVERAVEVLRDAEGVEEVLRREEAAALFRLPRDRIGDLLVLAEKEYTFGLGGQGAYTDVALRSHGSLHERRVPLILNREMELGGEVQNKDLLRLLMRGRWIEGSS